MWGYIGCFFYSNKEFIALYLYFISNSWIERNQSRNVYEIIFKEAQQFDERTERTVWFRLHISFFMQAPNDSSINLFLSYSSLCLGWEGNEGDHESSTVFHFKWNWNYLLQFSTPVPPAESGGNSKCQQY